MRYSCSDWAEHLLSYESCFLDLSGQGFINFVFIEFRKLSIGESPSKYPFLKNNGSEAPKGPRIHYFSGMDTYEDFLRLKIHHTLAPLFRYNKRF